MKTWPMCAHSRDILEVAFRCIDCGVVPMQFRSKYRHPALSSREYDMTELRWMKMWPMDTGAEETKTVKPLFIDTVGCSKSFQDSQNY